MIRRSLPRNWRCMWEGLAAETSSGTPCFHSAGVCWWPERMLMNQCLLFFAFCALPLAAAESTVELDPARTTISFTLADVLHTVHGTFTLKRGSITFDSAKIG